MAMKVAAFRAAAGSGWTRYLYGLGAFYLAWLAFVALSDSWDVVCDGWPVALAMALGSFVAGSTPMGGGTVGFPLLVLGFDFPATLGRDFSFAIQSVGMVSAASFILVTRKPLSLRMLGPALKGSLIGTPLGLIFFAPWVSGVVVKVAFAVLWASFGLTHLAKLRELVGLEGTSSRFERFEPMGGFLVGALGGGLVASLTGVGVDMLIYVVLVLVCRVDMKIAIPTSVVLMAFTSLVGIVTQTVTGRLDLQVFGPWLAAAPVVAIGAPLGSWVVDRLGRVSILVFVSLLCLLQFAWTLHHEAPKLGTSGLVWSFVALGGAVVVFVLMDRVGTARSRARMPILQGESPQIVSSPAE